MMFDETRDNLTGIETQSIEADAHEETREGIRRSKPFMDDYLPEQDEPEEDDGQPSEYDEWQDYMGGDEYYDHSENSMW
tara:strand:- start:746 stop:982 length:237 start_codon:yes stop_codon:yes gene_type:complete